MTPKELYLEAMRRTDAGDIEGFLELQADDAQWNVPGAQPRGKDQVREWLGPFYTGFSSYRHDLTRVFEQGNVVWAEGVWTGTNDGPLVTPDGEAPATGRTVAFPFGMSVTIDEALGQATEVNVYFDQLGFLAQLGLIPEGAAG
jgi:ketosteroid isomerase-like protein